MRRGGDPRAARRARPLVVHVINTAEVGGGAEHLVQLARGLGDEGFDSAAVVGRDGPATERLRATGAAVGVLGAMGPGAPMRLVPRLRRLSPDVVHLHGSRAGLAGAVAARLAGLRPVVYTAHAFSFRRRMAGPWRWAAARAEAVTCRLADRVICLSRDDLEAAAARGIATGRFSVVPNGVDLERFPARENRRSELGLSPGAPVVGMIARLVPQKDPVAFVHVARAVAAEVPEARFVLAGDGPLRRVVEESGGDLIAAGRLVLTGFRADVPELLASLDVVVTVARWEGLPLALLEAMAAGRAVVATALPVHAETLAGGEAGVLVPAGDPRRIAAEVAALLRDPRRRADLGCRARTRVESLYTVRRMVAETAGIYRSLGAPGG